MEGLSAVIEQLEKQRDAINRALEALHFVGGSTAPAPTSNANRRSLAQKARWAAVKGETSPKKHGGGLTTAGRKRLSDNMRKRWAAKRKAAK